MKLKMFVKKKILNKHKETVELSWFEFEHHLEASSPDHVISTFKRNLTQ